MKTTQWVLDPLHSELGFKIRHLMISNVSGAFTRFDVAAETEGDDFARAKVTATVEVASIHTKNEQRDAHLRNADFFDAETHPHIRFVATRIERVDEATFTLHGALTIKDITRPVQLAVEHSGVTNDPWGGQRSGFSVSGKINRKDWGIHYNAVLETGGVALGEEVKIQAEIQLVKQAVAVAV
jgi:polyisoprenoid-binding protein YceI